MHHFGSGFICHDEVVLTPTIIVNSFTYRRYTSFVRKLGRNSHTALVKFEVEINEFKELPEFDYESVNGKDF